MRSHVGQLEFCLPSLLVEFQNGQDRLATDGGVTVREGRDHRGERRPVGACRKPLSGGRLVGEPEPFRGEQGAGAEIIDHQRSVTVRQLRDRPRLRRLREAGLAEVGRMDAQHEPGLAVDEGGLEVGRSRPVRRPDLDEPGAGPTDDFGDPDAAADLDQLTPRHGHPTSAAGQPNR